MHAPVGQGVRLDLGSPSSCTPLLGSSGASTASPAASLGPIAPPQVASLSGVTAFDVLTGSAEGRALGRAAGWRAVHAGAFPAPLPPARHASRPTLPPRRAPADNAHYPNPPGWGLSYQINGEESPVLNVVRGTTYTFTVKAGPAHPLYLTDSLIGGGSYGGFKGETIYAGGEDAHGERQWLRRMRVAWLASSHAGARVGAQAPTARPAGTAQAPRPRQHTLVRSPAHPPACTRAGTPEAPYTFTWTPGAETPELLYYHCTTHQKLGWEIRVADA